jgi:hypothetical protein
MFKYEEIDIRQGYGDVNVYTFQGTGYHDGFVEMLNIIGKNGWELVGEIRGKIIVKKFYS